jgi:uncharacterized protein YqjF (DUF2071 family)
LSVLGARICHHLPYYYARISLERSGNSVRFESRRRHPGARPGEYAASYEPAGNPFDATEDPLAEFLLERYRFYTQASDGSLRYTDVEHDTWTLCPAEATVDTDTVVRASGFRRPETEPVYYYSAGLDVSASRSQRVANGGGTLSNEQLEQFNTGMIASGGDTAESDIDETLYG